MKKSRIRVYPPGMSALLLARAEWFATKTEQAALHTAGYRTAILTEGTDQIIVTTSPHNTIVKVKSAGIWVAARGDVSERAARSPVRGVADFFSSFGVGRVLDAGVADAGRVALDAVELFAAVSRVRTASAICVSFGVRADAVA